MRIWLDCIPCTVKMAMEAARISIKHEEKIKAFMEDVLTIPALRGEDWNIISPDIVRIVWERMVLASRDSDPLREIKANQNRRALGLCEQAGRHVRNSADPLMEALKFAIAGNSMDAMLGTGDGVSPGVFDTSKMSVTGEGVEQLRERLADADRIVYLTDNCGEVVFDELFLQILQENGKYDVTAVVRSLPVLNDVTMDEARSVGLDKIVPVIENGIPFPFPGTRLNLVSKEVRELLVTADLILSKGVGNYDSLTEDLELKGKIFFLFHGKCHPCCAPRNISLGTLIVEQF